ncbi:MAG: HAMP domain-containing histidine kinase [Ruminococcaceae bacterium]|nr:HAMP domain-containing histidine kinase [Oscillospiraceae bacterium]
MKNGAFSAALTAVFILELAALLWFAFHGAEHDLQDTVAVNEAVRSVQNDWRNIAAHTNQTALDYVVINNNGEVLFKTRTGLSESVNSAIAHRDTVLDIEVDGAAAGKIIVCNDGSDNLKSARGSLVTAFAAAAAAQLIICIGYSVYLNVFVVKPFRKMKGFAERVAGGNLDIPLEMDRGNLFGAFTESFDIMRSELKKARLAEARANASKKELVAKLSHDIRTPVASIKAVSELGSALSDNEKTRESFTRIISKADQINTLVGNLFSATLEELQQLAVTPADIPSTELRGMLESSDYFRRAHIPDIPECMIYADKLRLQQVFDNIFANSYKYANTDIKVSAALDNGRLAVEIEDFGGGVNSDELPALKEKWGRGSNAEGIDGAGLGLHISDRFMTEMKGELLIENGKNGLKITVFISLSGNLREI